MICNPNLTHKLLELTGLTTITSNNKYQKSFRKVFYLERNLKKLPNTLKINLR